MTVEGIWNLAKQLTFLDKEGYMDSKTFGKIFPHLSKEEVFNLSPYEVHERIEKYEKQINVGDIIKYDIDTIALVVDKINENDMYVLNENGCCEEISLSCTNHKKIDSTSNIYKVIMDILGTFSNKQENKDFKRKRISKCQ